MCNGGGSSADYRTAHEKLADLLSKELGVSVNAAALRLLLQHKWDRVTLLAHLVHDDKPSA